MDTKTAIETFTDWLYIAEDETDAPLDLDALEEVIRTLQRVNTILFNRGRTEEYEALNLLAAALIILWEDRAQRTWPHIP